MASCLLVLLALIKFKFSKNESTFSYIEISIDLRSMNALSVLTGKSFVTSPFKGYLKHWKYIADGY